MNLSLHGVRSLIGINCQIQSRFSIRRLFRSWLRRHQVSELLHPSSLSTIGPQEHLIPIPIEACRSRLSWAPSPPIAVSSLCLSAAMTPNTKNPPASSRCPLAMTLYANDPHICTRSWSQEEEASESFQLCPDALLDHKNRRFRGREQLIFIR